MNRPLTGKQSSKKTQDGAGVRINRSMTQNGLGAYDPFLLLDEIASDDAGDYIGGFPEHPHRGFETVTYMLEGRMRHTDHMGNEGIIQSGDVQWMTAGRGILHSEMPEQEAGRFHGFQLWVNLPAAQKMKDPRYQEIPSAHIPTVTTGKTSEVRVIAGEFRQGDEVTSGPVTGIATLPDFFDVRLSAGDSTRFHVDPDKHCFIYVYDGDLRIVSESGSPDQSLSMGQLGVLGAGDEVALQAPASARMLVLAGQPVAEPIAQWGPFVMNTEAEIQEAISDYRAGRLAS